MDTFLAEKDLSTSPHDMLRFLENEESVLIQMKGKIMEELQRLQVEEDIFLRVLRILHGQKTNDDVDANKDEDENLADAIEEALFECGNDSYLHKSEIDEDNLSIDAMRTSILKEENSMHDLQEDKT